ncbi:MAG: acetolactate decarboxylase [Clostridia bacterium]|nr:acetolactate decarboxylase [Clostridia bacterium]
MKKIICTSLALLMLTGCAANVAKNDLNRETIYQVSLLQGLTDGDFEGSVTIGELKKHGDTGIGTFNGLNGELVLVDGTVYQAAGDGSVNVLPDTETIPFSNVTFFDKDSAENIENVDSFEKLTNILNAKVKELGENDFYMVRIDGTFDEINVRSEYGQKEPYKTITEALATDQTFFDYKDINGTMVGLYCPKYMSELNSAGWHFHFVSDDKSKGGHVLGVKVKKAEIGYDKTEEFYMHLPSSSHFRGIDFAKDRSADVKKAETNE